MTLEEMNKSLGIFIKKIENFSSHIQWGDESWATYGDYIWWNIWQVRSLKTALFLAENNDYKSAFAIIRTTFESFFSLWLSMNGEVHYQLVKKQPNENIQSALARVRQQIINDNIQNVLRVEIHNDKKIIVFVKGLYDGSGHLTPWFYFLLREYDATHAYLSSDIYSGEFVVNKKSRMERKAKNSSIQRYFLSFSEPLFIHLRENKYISKERHKSLIIVHYNFLSQFVHSNRRALDLLSMNDENPYVSNFDLLLKKDNTLYHLSLLYIGFILCDYFELLNNFFNKVKTVDNYDENKSAIDDFRITHNYFWYIKNEPSLYDHYSYAMDFMMGHRNRDNSFYQNWEINIPKWRIPAFKNPYDRLKKMRGSAMNILIGTYRPTQDILNTTY